MTRAGAEHPSRSSGRSRLRRAICGEDPQALARPCKALPLPLATGPNQSCDPHRQGFLKLTYLLHPTKGVGMRRGIALLVAGLVVGAMVMWVLPAGAHH